MATHEEETIAKNKEITKEIMIAVIEKTTPDALWRNPKDQFSFESIWNRIYATIQKDGGPLAIEVRDIGGKG
jgi:hypothetical protein